MIPKIFLFGQKRAAVSRDPQKRHGVLLSVHPNWKAAIMAKAMGDPGFKLPPIENARGIGWMAKDFSVTFKDMHEKVDFRFSPGRVVASYLGHAVGEIDYSVRYSMYLGKYIYCNTPHLTGSKMRMGFTKYPELNGAFRCYDGAHEDNGTWIPVGLLVDEKFRGKGLGTALVSASMMREYLGSNIKFIVIGDPEYGTVRIGTKLGLERLSRGSLLGGHIDPKTLLCRMLSIADIPGNSIPNIKVRHVDPLLTDFLANVRRSKVQSEQSEGLSSYALPDVSLEALKYRNVRFSFKSKGKGFCETTDQDNLLHGNNILFTSRKCTISTKASHGLSYLLWDRKSKLAAAVQVSAIYVDDLLSQKSILRYAIDTIMRLSPDAEISIFISGGCNTINQYLHPSEYMDTTVKIRDSVTTAVTEAFSRGASVDTVDVGGFYLSQQLNTETGEYSAKLEPLE